MLMLKINIFFMSCCFKDYKFDLTNPYTHEKAFFYRRNCLEFYVFILEGWKKSRQQTNPLIDVFLVLKVNESKILEKLFL